MTITDTDTEDEGPALLAAIRHHYDTHGSKNWQAVRSQFPAIGERRFWRYVAKVKEGTTDHAILRQSIAYAKRMAKKSIPAPLSPAILAGGGADMRRSLDFMSHLEEMIDDISMLRDYAMTDPDANGDRKIRNAMFFAQSIKLRKETLELALKAYQEIYDIRKMMEFYDAIVRVIHRADPETAKELMEELAALNNERGFTLTANIG